MRKLQSGTFVRFNEHREASSLGYWNKRFLFVLTFNISKINKFKNMFIRTFLRKKYDRESFISMHSMHRSDIYSIFNRKFNFDDSIVGKALIRGMCSYEASGGIGVDHSTVAGLVASTIAHEMGHNFGK